eukprot:520266-Alexandrium_andersonii.AAC.1
MFFGVSVTTSTPHQFKRTAMATHLEPNSPLRFGFGNKCEVKKMTTSRIHGVGLPAVLGSG